MRVAGVGWALVVGVMACSSPATTSPGTDGGADTGRKGSASSSSSSRDAGGANATSGHDAGASHDATSSHADASQSSDSGGSHDAATRDAPSRDAAKDAPDAATPGCTYTGEPAGTIDTIAQNGGSSTIEDFDVGCAGLYAVDSMGGIQSCPALGCGTTVTSIAADGTFAKGPASIRIGTPGLYLLDPSTTPGADAASPTPVQLTSLGANGTNAAVIATLPESPNQRAGLLLGGPGAVAFFIGTGSSSLEVLQPADGGASSFVAFPGNYPGGPNGGPEIAAVSPSGKVEFVEYNGLSGADSRRIARIDLTTSDTTGTTYFTGESGTFAGVLVASDDLVLWGLPDANDAGSKTLSVCASAAPCASPQAVTNVGAFTPFWMDDTALFMKDAANDLAVCATSELVTGTCTPTMIATALPSYTRFQTDAYNAYLLTSDGTKILRIAK